MSTVRDEVEAKPSSPVMFYPVKTRVFTQKNVIKNNSEKENKTSVDANTQQNINKKVRLI